MEFELFRRILLAMADAGVEYVLVGGVAVNLHGVVRATEDIDLFVRLDDENIERLKSALRAIWDDPEIATFSAGDFSAGYATLRYAPPDTAIVVDIITRIGTKLDYSDIEYQLIDIGGVSARVATIPTLIRMEESTARSVDRRCGRSSGLPAPAIRPEPGRRAMTPIQRFRDFEAAREGLWLAPGDPRLVAKIRHVWEFGRRLAKYPPPRGLWLFREIEEANAHREAWTAERVRRLSEERAGG